MEAWRMRRSLGPSQRISSWLASDQLILLRCHNHDFSALISSLLLHLMPCNQLLSTVGVEPVGLPFRACCWLRQAIHRCRTWAYLSLSDHLCFAPSSLFHNITVHVFYSNDLRHQSSWYRFEC